MMCYKDMTFCSGAGCRCFEGCPRALTKEVYAAAQAWWGGDDPPICEFTSPRNLPCYNVGLDENKVVDDMRQFL